MKKMRMLSVLLALTVLGGCGAAQAETEATSVNQAMLIERSSRKQESYTFPERLPEIGSARKASLPSTPTPRWKLNRG